MMQFLSYLADDRSSVPNEFLLPLETKLILFNDNRQRMLKDERDTKLLVGCFIFCKVIAGKLFMKPYKMCQYFDTDIHDLEQPMVFKENCLSMGYLLIALFTDVIYELYKPELERLENVKFDKKDVVM